MNVLDPIQILCHRIGARWYACGMPCPNTRCPLDASRPIDSSLSITKSHWSQPKAYDDDTHTLVRPLSRASKSVVSSDAIRHMRVAGMEESAKSGSKESHALRHCFGDPRSALPAPGHLEAPAPWARTELCRYPFGLLSAVGADCGGFHSDDKVVRASDTDDPLLTKGKGLLRATFVDTDGTTNALTSFEGLSEFMPATSADNGVGDGSNLDGWTIWCYAFP
jgi:hypothetical protein